MTLGLLEVHLAGVGRVRQQDDTGIAGLGEQLGPTTTHLAQRDRRRHAPVTRHPAPPPMRVRDGREGVERRALEPEAVVGRVVTAGHGFPRDAGLDPAPRGRAGDHRPQLDARGPLLVLPRRRPSRPLDVEEQPDDTGLRLGLRHVEQVVEGVTPRRRARGVGRRRVAAPRALGAQRDEKGRGVLAGHSDGAGAVTAHERAVIIGRQRHLGPIDRRPTADDPRGRTSAVIGDDDARHPPRAGIVAGAHQRHAVEGCRELTVREVVQRVCLMLHRATHLLRPRRTTTVCRPTDIPDPSSTGAACVRADGWVRDQPRGRWRMPSACVRADGLVRDQPRGRWRAPGQDSSGRRPLG